MTLLATIVFNRDQILEKSKFSDETSQRYSLVSSLESFNSNFKIDAVHISELDEDIILDNQFDNTNSIDNKAFETYDLDEEEFESNSKVIKSEIIEL